VREVRRPGRQLSAGRAAVRVGRAVRSVGRGAGAAEDETTLEADLEAMAARIEGALREGEETFSEAMRRVDSRLEAEAEADFYTCVVFQTRAQRDAFLQRLGYGPDEDTSFLDGEELARRMGVPVPPGPPWLEPKVKELFAPFALRPGQRRR
jgi:hypothetical protein